MDNQDKVAKINAELARLELEMELDHGDSMIGRENLGMQYFRKLIGTNTEDANGAHRIAFELLLEAVFKKINTWVDAYSLTSSKMPEPMTDKVLKMFKVNTGKATKGHLLIWDCGVAERRFYVLMRVFDRATQYSVVRVDGIALKDFSKLEYSEGASSDEASVDLFIERIARAIVKGTDILGIVLPRSAPSKR